jgi:hypothetical protein
MRTAARRSLGNAVVALRLELLLHIQALEAESDREGLCASEAVDLYASQNLYDDLDGVLTRLNAMDS